MSYDVKPVRMPLWLWRVLVTPTVVVFLAVALTWLGAVFVCACLAGHVSTREFGAE